jgi:hypothetical protein
VPKRTLRSLGVLSALAKTKNTFWARPCLSVHRVFHHTATRTLDRTVATMTLDHTVETMNLEHIVAIITSDNIVAFHNTVSLVIP